MSLFLSRTAIVGLPSPSQLQQKIDLHSVIDPVITGVPMSILSFGLLFPSLFRCLDPAARPRDGSGEGHLLCLSSLTYNRCRLG